MNSSESLLIRLSAGGLSERSIATAAALGHSGALATGIPSLELDQHYRTSIEQIALPLSDKQCIDFCCEAATRTLPMWEARFPNDARPTNAVVACQAWIADRVVADFDHLSNEAQQAIIDADYPGFTDDVDPELCRAMAAAESASHASICIDAFLQNEDHDEICEIVGWVARATAKAARDRDAERQWMATRLVALLLG